jgi:hypothetical protein|nr:MAG TPA: hypothetical protein [Caudoviricetes sp.]
MTAKEFITHWLNGRQACNAEHDEEWEHFIDIVTAASEAYHEFMEKRKLLAEHDRTGI